MLVDLCKALEKKDNLDLQKERKTDEKTAFLLYVSIDLDGKKMRKKDTC